MGEYATRRNDGAYIKTGTCESLYYLRWDDIDKVKPDGSYSLREPGLWFRLPFSDEDHLQPGDYSDYNRGVRLLPYQEEDDPAPINFKPSGTPSPGNIQLTHACGLLLNVACHHGAQLPAESQEIRAHWNGKDPFPWELYMVKHQAGEGLLPIIRCRHCGNTYRTDWASVLPHIVDEVLRARLTDYAAQVKVPALV